MGYIGEAITLQLGRDGLRSDDPQTEISFISLIEAQNVILGDGIIQKDRGSRKWNTSALADGVLVARDWIPDTTEQSFIVVLDDGTVFKLPVPETQTLVTASGGAPTTLIRSTNPQIVEGGAETAGRDRKLFIFTGENPIQVISGTAIVRTDLSKPRSDWTGSNHPAFGLVFEDRLVALGPKNDAHRIFLSSPSDYEDFTPGGGGIQFSVFPGEGSALISACVYKGRLLLFKRPFGVYYLETNGSADTADWSIKKLSGSFGIASPNSCVSVGNDILVKNSTNSLTSMQAVETLGGIDQGDLLKRMRIKSFIRQRTSGTNIARTFSMNYEAKDQTFFTYQASDGVVPNRMLRIDTSLNEPRADFITKDQPNCLMLRRDIFGVDRPFYGADDGFIYEMDRENRNVAGSGYEGLFQTPHTDFGFADPKLGGQRKLFDFLGMDFEETGNWNVDVDVFIDQKFIETISFNQSKGVYLDSTFQLDKVELGEAKGRVPRNLRMRLRGQGRRISFRVKNSTADQNFKLVSMTVYFRLADESHKAE